MPALDRLKPMPFANMLVQRRGGRVTAYAAGVNEGHGHGQFPEKYAKFAYDTRFGFCASRSREVLNQAAPDSIRQDFAQYSPVYPQECGSRTEVYCAAVTGSGLNIGIGFAGDGMTFSALPYTPHELENARHLYGLPRDDNKTVVRCALFQREGIPARTAVLCWKTTPADLYFSGVS